MLGKAKTKDIQSLGQKKHRDETRLFIAEGPKIVKELLHAIPGQVKEVYAVKEWLKENESLASGTSIYEVSDIELEKLSQLKTPHQVVAIVSQFEETSSIETKDRISLVLDTIQDPGNLGTIIRIADWFGVMQVICSGNSADVYNPKVVQATMGSIARVRVSYKDLSRWLNENAGIRIYAAALEGKDVSKMGRVHEGLIMIGNESTGLDRQLLEMANEKITITRKGQAESLNAAVATGIILSHLT
jgi:TrmH family RNA methyltransferase